MSNMVDKICSTCKSGKIEFDEDSGKFICKYCGLEYEGLLDEEENQTTREDENGIQLVEPSNPNRIEFGATLIIKENGKNKIIKQYSKSSRITKNFIRIEKLLQGKASKKIIDETKDFYGKIIENKKNMQGRNIDHLIIGIYYYVLRKNNQAKSTKDISVEFNKSERIIKKAFNSIKSDIVDYTDENEIKDVEKNYIESFIGGDLKRYDLKSLTYDIIDNFNKSLILEGKAPKTIAGLSLGLSCKLLKDNLCDNEEFFSKFSNKNTLEKAFEEIKDCLNSIIPQKYADKIIELQSKGLFE